MVTDGLMKAFPEGMEIYKWLSEKRQYMGALRLRHCLQSHLFLHKGQEKKDDVKCNVLLYGP